MSRKGGDKERSGREPAIDIHRAFVFPNRMREFRQRAGYARLLHFAAELRDIPYIRLSKIERGEVFARPEELRRIAAALKISPTELLIDIDLPTFDIARWAEPFGVEASDRDDERFAVLLAAALRARRMRDSALTIAAIERGYGIAPVNLSRLENALKPFGRWNVATRAAVMAIFDVSGEDQLRREIARQHEAGELDGFIHAIATPESRHARSRARIAEIAAALGGEAGGVSAIAVMQSPNASPSPAAMPAPSNRIGASAVATRLVPVHGTPMGNGLISAMPTGTMIEAPRIAGRRAFGLRMCRATLGGGLPSQATLIVDPDRYPAPGGLAVLREQEGWRVLSVGSDREGRMIGYSANPEMEIPLDGCAPDSLAAVVAAIYI